MGPENNNLIGQNKTCGGGGDRLERATDMMEAINNLNEVNSRLQRIIDRATLNDTKVAERPTDPHNDNASLAEVLAGGPTMIRDKITVMHSNISQIEEIIF